MTSDQNTRMPKVSPADDRVLINELVDRWSMDALLLHLAEACIDRATDAALKRDAVLAEVWIHDAVVLKRAADEIERYR